MKIILIAIIILKDILNKINIIQNNLKMKDNNKLKEINLINIL